MDKNKDNSENRDELNKEQPMAKGNEPKGKYSYSAQSIKQEEGAAAHRQSPARYMGADDSEGIFNQLIEIVDNSIDELMDYYSEPNENIEHNPTLILTINEDDSVVVEDFGRGIPCEKNEETGIPAIITAAESDSAGGKGRDTEGYSTVTSGIHGAGMAISKSLSEYFIFEVNSLSAQGRYRLEYKLGERVGDLERIGDLETNEKGEQITGTKITYKYDPTMLTPSREGVKEDHPYREKEIYDKIAYSLIGQSPSIEVKFTYKDSPMKVISPETVSPEIFLKDDDLVKITLDGENAPQPYMIDLFISLDMKRAIGERKTIVNRLNTTTAPTDNVIAEEIRFQLEEFLRRDKSIDAITQDYGLPPDALKKKLSTLTIMQLKGAAFAGQNKSILKSRSYINHLKGNLQMNLKSNKDFLNNTYKKAREVGKRNAELQKYQQKIEKQRERDIERKKKEKTKAQELDSIENDLSARNQAQEESDITLKPSPMRAKDSTLIYVEGDSAGSALNDLHRDGDQPIAVAIMRGNPPNAFMEKTMSDLTRDNVAFCLRGGYKDIGYLSDADSDGNHIKILLAYQTWRYASKYLKEGKVYIIPAPYGEIFVYDPCVINLYGEIKTYTSGRHRTYSGKEHKTLMEMGARSQKVYTGLANSGDTLEILKDRSKWIPIEKVIKEDIQLIEMLLEGSSDFKKQFMSLAYSDRQFFTNKVQRSKRQIEIPTKQLYKIYKESSLTKNPNIADYRSDLHENLLEEWGEQKW